MCALRPPRLRVLSGRILCAEKPQAQRFGLDRPRPEVAPPFSTLRLPNASRSVTTTRVCVCSL